MNIKCKSCNTEIDLLTIEPLVKEKSLTCKGCGTLITVRPRVGSKGFDVVFDLDKRKVRTCINCSKKFYAPASEAIPLCPTCRDESSLEEQEFNAYYVIKAGDEKKGPYSLEMIGEWIKDGLLSTSDIIQAPDKNKFKAHEIPELYPYIKAYRAISKKKEGPKLAKKLPSPSVKYRIFNYKLMLMIAFIFFALWLYLVFKSPPKTVPPSTLNLLLNAWQSSYPDLKESPKFYYDEGLRGLNEYNQNSCKRAKGDFIKAFIRSKGDPAILSYVAMSLTCIWDFEKDKELTLQAYDLASIALQEGVKKTAYIAMGDILFKQGKVEEAKAEIKKALAISPSDPFANLIYGRCLLHTDRKSEEAIISIERSLKGSGLSYGHAVLGINALSNEEYKKALNYFNRKIKHDADTESLYNRARIQVMRKKYDGAISDLERSLKLDPGGHFSRILLNQILFKINNQTDEPIRQLNAMLKDESTPRSVVADADLLLSSIHLKTGNYKKALEMCDDGLKIKPTDPYLKLNKIRAMLSMGSDKDRVFAIIEDFTTGQKNYPEIIRLFLAEIFDKFNMKREEFDFLVEYTEKSPKFFYPFVKLAMIMLDKKDIDKARKILTTGINKTLFFTGREFLPDLRSPHLEISPAKINSKLSKAGSSLLNSDFIDTCEALVLLQGIPDTPSGPPITKTIADLQRVFTRDKSIKEAYFLQGFLYSKKGSLLKAEELLKKAQEMDINSLSVSLALGMTYTKQKKYKLAASALEESAGEEDLKFLSLYELGLLRLEEGKSDEAMKLFAEAREKQENFYPLIMTLFELEK